MRIIAVLLLVTAAVIGAGGAMEFAYFGPGTPQFLSGLIATPAGIAGMVGGAALWRRGVRAKRVVAVTAAMLLAATAAATILDVMGPPATLTGLVGGLPPLVWAWRKRHVQREEDKDDGRQRAS